MPDQYAIEIYRLLAPLLPHGWEKLVLLAKVTDTTYDFVYYVRPTGETQYLQCFEMASTGDISRKRLMETFKNLFDLCLKVRKEIQPGQKVWSHFTFVLNKDGEFSFDYGYGEYGLGVSDEWANKYLK